MAASKQSMPSSSSASVMLRGGRNRTTSGPAWSTEYAVTAAHLAELTGAARPLPPQHGADHQALAAHLGDESDLVVERRETFSQPLALAFDVGEQLRGAQLAQHHARHRGRDRIPTEGGAVTPRLEGLGRPLSDQHRPDGQAAAERLGDGHHVGNDPSSHW